MDTAKIRALLAAADPGQHIEGRRTRWATRSRGVTHIIRALEEEAGFPLLLRGNRGVRLTADGERLAPLFRELAAMADRLEQELALTRGVERGAVRIGTYSSISLHWLPQILELFQQRYPKHTRGAPRGQRGAEIAEWLSGGRIDIAFTSLRPDSPFDNVKILADPMYAVLPCGHPPRA